MLTSRNADMSQFMRDIYTKSWSAFDCLMKVVLPGGSIRLVDNKLFPFYHLQGDVYSFSVIKGIYHFETDITDVTDVKEQEIRELRAILRCLVKREPNSRLLSVLGNGRFVGCTWSRHG